MNRGANIQEMIKYIKSSRIRCAGFVVSVAGGLRNACLEGPKFGYNKNGLNEASHAFYFDLFIKYMYNTVKHNSVIDFIKAYFLHCFINYMFRL